VTGSSGGEAKWGTQIRHQMTIGYGGAVHVTASRWEVD
jgi:hypothetical protein